MKILVVGGSGMVARELTGCLHESEHDAVFMGRPALDLHDPNGIRKALHVVEPDLLINTGAYTAVDKAEQEPERAFLTNRDGARSLAEACQGNHVPLIHLSTDYVFDGQGTQPVSEDSPAGPLNVYGRSKWEGEEAIRAVCDQHLIVRTSWLYGRHGANFLNTMLRLGKSKQEIRVINDRYGCPTWTKDLARALLVLCKAVQRQDGSVPWGTFHFCGAGQTTWYEFAKTIFSNVEGLETLTVKKITPISAAAWPAPAIRPSYSVLRCEKIRSTFGVIPPLWQDSLVTCIREMYVCQTLRPVTS